jgi:hypothetical protein
VIAGTAVLTCSICGEPSHDICVYCTKDACTNHRCDRCKRCSDCCECDVPLSAAEAHVEPPVEAPVEAPVQIVAEPEVSIFAPEPEPAPPREEAPPFDEWMP